MDFNFLFEHLHLCLRREPLSPRLTFLMIVLDRGFTFRGPGKDNQKSAWNKTILAACMHFQRFLGLVFFFFKFYEQLPECAWRMTGIS